MRSPDLFKLPFDPLREALRALLQRHGASAAAAAALVDLVDVAMIALVALLMVPIAARLYERGDSNPSATRGGASDPYRLAAALTASALIWWIVRHPSRNVVDFFTRWDHVIFCALAGGVLVRASPAVRGWILGLVNVIVMWQYFGPVATPLVLAGVLVTFLALAWDGWPAALVIAAVGGALYGVCWYLRATGAPGHGVQTFGLLSLVFLRQISAAAALAGAGRPAFGHYLCYVSYYLGGFGPVSGPEVYTDFSRRNFGARLHYDPRTAARHIAWGAVQIWIAYRVPATFADLQHATTMLSAWGISLLLFARSAIFGMGLWAVTEGLALFHGIRLHPSFRGILTRQNPSELWWAWRGAFTNWLVRHVYAPLSARGYSKTASIYAAFTVSWAWHVLGVPFVTNRLTLLTLAPITLWALVNASAVTGHQFAREQGLHILPGATPPLLRRVIHTFLIACLGTFSVTFLSYQGDPAGGFFPFLRVLFGLGR